MRVADGLRVNVSQHVQFTDFGVKSQHSHQSGKYICSGTAGTGFFVRDTESDAYHHFVNDIAKISRPNYFRYVFGKEFTFEKELKAVDLAMSNTNRDSKENQIKLYILESYQNVLGLAKTASMIENITVAIKKKIKGNPKKSTISPLSHYRSRMEALNHDLKTTQLEVENLVTDKALLDRYYAFIEDFKEAMNCRRVWNTVGDYGHTQLVRVFWDMGIFDYLMVRSGTPIMRDGKGICYYIYPNYIVKAKSSIDFELIPLKNLHFVYRETTQESLVSTVASHEDSYGKPLGEVSIEELELRWYFLHRRNAHRFVEAITKYIEQL